MKVTRIDDCTKQISLSIQELEDALEKADVIDGGEAISEVRTLPGELLITVVQ